MSNAAEKAAVKRGVAFLDEADAGWWACVDLRKFNMWDAAACTFGQVYREPLWEALKLLGIHGRVSELGIMSSFPKTTTHGLCAEWERAIKAKQRGR